MTISLVQVGAVAVAVPGTSVVSGAITAATAGNLLLAVCSVRAGSPGTPSVAGYAQLATGTLSDGSCIAALFGKVAVGGETTATLTSTSSDNLGIALYQFTGFDGALPAVDDIDTAETLSTTATTLTSTAVTTSVADCLVMQIGSLSALQGATNTWTNSFTALSSTQRIRGAYRLPGSAASYSTAHTWTNGAKGVLLSVALRVASAGASNPWAPATGWRLA